MRLLVLVDGWEVECCLGPPAVGDRVRWALQLVEAGRYPLDAALLQQVTATVVPLPIWEGATLDTSPVWLDLPGAALYWEAPAPVPAGPVVVRGSVHLAHHGEAVPGLPETEGTVARLRMVGTLYEERPPGARSWEPVQPPDVVLRDLAASPRWFRDDVDRASPVRLESALLVDLDVVG